jgi:pyruvate dehydrogenase E2 component (dihydrolipoamide acetyltransferase)
VLVEWLVASDQMVPVESAIARIEIDGKAVAEVRKPAARVSQTVAGGTPVAIEMPGSVAAVARVSGLRARSSTAARAAARRAGFDLSGLRGTGRNGRITRADVATASRPARATYHVETAKGRIFFREWPAHGQLKGHVLLIHGLFADSQSFTTLGRKLSSRGFRTLALDLPAHGETESPVSSVADIAAAITASLPPVRFHIVGHSLGAVVASRLISHAAALTLLSPAGCGDEINGTFVTAMLAGDLDRAISFLGEAVPPDALSALAEHLSANGPQLRAIASDLAEGGRQKLSILGPLAGTDVPVQAVFLRDDPIIPAAHALSLPFNVAVRIMPGVSHLPHWRDVDAIAGLVASTSGSV